MKKSKIKIILLSILLSVIISIQLMEILFFSSKTPLYITICDTISIIIYIFIGISYIIKLNKIKKGKEYIVSLETYNQNLKNLYDSTRAFKHDFNNIIQTIGGYAIMNDIEGLKKYQKEICKDCIEINNLEMLNPTVFNNPAIFSIINSKVYKAKSLGIEMNINVSLDLNKINMKTYEVTRVLGILLDNAIEASKECDNKLINVEFVMSKSGKMQLVKIDNTYKEKDINIDKIFEKDYSTKPGNTGLGLWEVREILKKNKNLNLFTSKDNEFFKQQLEIYV